jgi:hypothetical protein
VAFTEFLRFRRWRPKWRLTPPPKRGITWRYEHELQTERFRAQSHTLGQIDDITVSTTALVGERQAQGLLTHHVREVTKNGEAQRIGRLPTGQIVSLDVVLTRDQAGLERFLKEVYDPTEPSYRHFLTVPEFTERFGPSQEDYDSVISFAKAHGFNPATTAIAASGGNLYQLHSNGQIWKSTGVACSSTSCPGWTMLDDNPLAAAIVADGSNLYELHSSGTVWKPTGVACSGTTCSGWTELDDNTATTQIVAGGGQLYQFHGRR